MLNGIFVSLIVVLLFFTNTHANDPYEVQKQKADSLYELVRKYIDIKPDSALYFAKQQKEIAFVIDDYEEKVLSCFAIGAAHCELKSYDMAINTYFKGLTMLKDPKKLFFKELKVSYLQNIGVVYELTNNFDLALEYALQALHEASLTGDDKKRAELIYNLGVIYARMMNIGTAKYYYNKAISIGLNIEDNYRLSKTYNMLGNLYFDQSHYDSAKKYFVKAYRTSLGIKELANEQDMFLGNTGECYYQTNEFNKARQFYLKALPISKQFSNAHRIK